MAHHVMKKEKVKSSTYDITREFILKKLSHEDMAKKRSLSFGTILGHLEKLVAKGKINPKLDLAYFKPETGRYEKIIGTFEKVRQQTGEVRLAPVREALGDDFSYEELRVARLFLN